GPVRRLPRRRVRDGELRLRRRRQLRRRPHGVLYREGVRRQVRRAEVLLPGRLLCGEVLRGDRELRRHLLRGREREEVRVQGGLQVLRRLLRGQAEEGRRAAAAAAADGPHLRGP